MEHKCIWEKDAITDKEAALEDSGPTPNVIRLNIIGWTCKETGQRFFVEDSVDPNEFNISCTELEKTN